MSGIPELPAVCVLMATHNGKRWIAEQLSSILDQRGVRVEVWISDDRSSDGLPEWLAQRAAEDSRVRLLSHDLRFGTAAKNFYHLLTSAPTQLFSHFALSDQDDIWHLDKLERHLHLMDLHQVDAVSSDVVAFWPSGRRILIKKSDPQRRWDHLFEPPGPGCSFLMRAALIDRCKAVLGELAVRGIEPMPFHDWMIYLVARASGMRWWIDPHPSLLYRQHDSNEVGAHVGSRAIRLRLRQLVQGRYKRLVEHAMQVAVVAATGRPKEEIASRLNLFDVLLQGRRCRRDALVATAFMPFGVSPRRDSTSSEPARLGV